MTDSPINSSTTPLSTSTVSTSDDYFEKRQLKQGAVGWLLLGKRPLNPMPIF